MRQGARQRVAGVVLNAHPNVARHDYDRLKAILHNHVRQGPRGRTGTVMRTSAPTWPGGSPMSGRSTPSGDGTRRPSSIGSPVEVCSNRDRWAAQMLEALIEPVPDPPSGHLSRLSASLALSRSSLQIRRKPEDDRQ
jgi:hypothetical protein